MATVLAMAVFSLNSPVIRSAITIWPGPRRPLDTMFLALSRTSPSTPTCRRQRPPPSDARCYSTFHLTAQPCMNMNVCISIGINQDIWMPGRFGRNKTYCCICVVV